MKAILFDFDGTIGDTYNLIMDSMRYSTQKVLGRVIPDEVLGSLIGTPLLEQMVVFAGGDAELGAELTRVYRQYNEAIHDQVITAFPHMPETLTELKDRGYKLGIVTSKRHELALRGAQVIGVDHLFDLLIAPDDYPMHKPHPGPVIEGCRRLGFEPSQCAYVGDSPYDMRAGIDAGCFTIAVGWGMFPTDVLMAENPQAFCASVPELLGFFPKEV